ncbi:efflux RND transporter periplasmic adaptor subunit [Solimicrobium silvestre]|uniref:Efflux transporter, RND family, MFP subunit n=1 Tax=Solimicrobium silvestre TaxID=2099400 RepID=A0A2S9H0Z2_9BURK|nr:efflux RND transporter periplasmic adaptor subunit [Solimicrobium silvestre]PRC93654.1 Efflux transporter, RND family, MFP subunit [Solimicrobium silvestre]
MSSNEIKTPAPRRLPGNLKVIALIIVAIAGAVVAYGLISRSRDKAALVSQAQERLIPIVKVIQPASRADAQPLTLPGTLQAFYSATVYARVSGYLKHWSVDIGAPVKSGQQLADIETPELDQQLKQSEANLETALANERLTEITSKRWQHLLASDSVSQQEADEKSGDYDAKKALSSAARADVDRLRVLESFKRITAPFDGVVTARKTDIGALINAGHDSGHELFTVADVHKLRLYVNVPQSYANLIQVGMKAKLDVPEHPGQTFDALLANNSRSVSEGSGTILVELEVDNKDGKLLPGEYGNVHFDLPRDMKAVQVPASALSFRKEGLTIATLTPDNRVAFRVVKISHDLGTVVEIDSGLAATDRLIDNPPDSLENGDQVRPAAEPAPSSTASAGGAKS